MNETEGTLAGDGGLRLVTDDVECDPAKAFALQQVGEGDCFEGVAGETVFGDAIGEVCELDGAGAELLGGALCGAHMKNGTPGQ